MQGLCDSMECVCKDCVTVWNVCAMTVGKYGMCVQGLRDGMECVCKDCGTVFIDVFVFSVCRFPARCYNSTGVLVAVMCLMSSSTECGLKPNILLNTVPVCLLLHLYLAVSFPTSIQQCI